MTVATLVSCTNDEWTVGTSGGTWAYWNEAIQFSSTGSTTSNEINYYDNTGAWSNWITVDLVDAADKTIWMRWLVDSSGSWTLMSTPELTAEERAEQERRREQRAAEEAERQRVLAEERAAVKARADALLAESMTEEQRAEFQRERFFTVESKTSKRRYRVKAGMGKHGNIQEVDEQGVAVASLCCAPVGNIPEADYLLGQKLHLEYNEDEFRRTANITNLRRPA